MVFRKFLLQIFRVQKIVVVEEMVLGEEMDEKVKCSDELPPCMMIPQSTPDTTTALWRSLDLSELSTKVFYL